MSQTPWRKPKSLDGTGWHDLKPILREDLADDSAMNVRQAEVAAAVTEGEPLVVQTRQVKNGGVEVVHVADIVDGMNAEIGRAHV